MELRKKTLKLLRNSAPHCESNRALLEDLFRDELWWNGSLKVDEFLRKGIKFTIRFEVRVLVTQVSRKCRIYFRTADGLDSREFDSFASARQQADTLAENILSAEKPLTKDQQEAVSAKAAAFDGLMEELAKINVRDPAGAAEAVAELVLARKKLGLGRSLLDFVITSLHRLEKDVEPCRLSLVILRLEKIIMGRPGGLADRKRTVRLLKRFAREVPAIMTEREFQERLHGADLPRRDSPNDPWFHNILSVDVQDWLIKTAARWRYRKTVRAMIANCFKLARNDLHALPSTLETAAQRVPVPKPPTDENPDAVAVLAFSDVWKILVNVQDQEMLFFISLAVFAGLHQSEIMRLHWEDITWNPGEVQILIGPTTRKKGKRKPLGHYLLVQHPLDAILEVGRGRTGRIVTTKKIRKRVSRLVKRLKLAWEQSIMRHTFASCLLGRDLLFHCK